MGSLNVNRNVEDAFYRYKMPRLLAKVEGKGNGIKTVIANMPEIAKALHRPPTYPTKYFGCELGAQTQFDLKNERYIVNGEHDAGKLQDLLDGFIRKFVLCPNCDNPETTLNVNAKRNTITQSCKACGHTGLIILKSRLITYIIKNPPQSIEEGAEVKVRKGKRGKENASPTEEAKEEVGLALPEDVENGKDESIEDEEEDWEPEPLPDEPDGGPLGAGEGAVAEEMSGAMAALTMHPDLEKSIEERLDMYHNYVNKALKEAGGLEGLNCKALLSEADRLDLREKAPLLLVRCIFTMDVLKEIPRARKLLSAFTSGNAKAQRYLMGGMEQLIVKDAEHKEELLPRAPLIYKALYDEDIVEEENLLEWGKKASKKYVSREESKEILEKAAPLLNWLREAEEESSDDEEDGVEFQEEGRKRGAVKPTPVQNGVAAGDKSKEDSGDDDGGLDIDDI